MDDAHLERLRRFSLTAALLLITYVAAGVTVEPNTPLAAFGVSLHIVRPDLLPVGLAVASLLSAARFYYYGLMLATSPRRRRRDLIDGLQVHADEYKAPAVFASGRTVAMYWGPRKFSTAPWDSDREVVEKRAGAFGNAFPKALGARASAQIVHEIFQGEGGEEHAAYSVEIVVPLRCRVAALLEDVDYSAPVWLNVLALLLFTWTRSRC